MIETLSNLIRVGFERYNTKKVSDDYISWLTFANAGMLHPGNIFCMDYAIKNLPSNSPVLEIGSFCGLSTNLIVYLLSKHNRKNQVFTADKWIFEGAEKGGNIGQSNISHHNYRDFVKESFKRNIGFFSSDNRPYSIELFSDEFFGQWGNRDSLKDIFGRDVELGGGISFCYVDGNHTYDYARRDFENVDKYLDVGGFILFDDSADSDAFGLTKLMKEIQDNKSYKLVMKNPNYLFVKCA